MGNLELIGKHLKSSRKFVRLSQTAVSKILGTSRQVVSAIESGRRNPTLEEMIKLSNLYRQKFDFFIEPILEDKNTFIPSEFLLRAKTKKVTGHDIIELNKFNNDFEKIAERYDDFNQPYFDDLISNLMMPLDIFRLCFKSNIFLKFTSLDNVSGALVRKGKKIAIILNSNQPEKRIRFSLAHELGHLIENHDPDKEITWTYMGKSYSSIEKSADDFAAELLMPATDLKAEYREVTKDNDLDKFSAYFLADKFFVSYNAILVRLLKLNLIRQETYTTLKKEKPRKIENELNENREKETQVEFKIDLLKNELSELQSYLGDDNPYYLRLLQEIALTKYIETTTKFTQRKHEPRDVYEIVALWLFENYPIIPWASKHENHS